MGATPLKMVAYFYAKAKKKKIMKKKKKKKKRNKKINLIDLVKLYFSTVKISAHWPTDISAVAKVQLIIQKYLSYEEYNCAQKGKATPVIKRKRKRKEEAEEEARS